MFSKHVTKNISAYCHGELNAEDSRAFNEHVLACVSCRSEFDDIKLGIKFAQHLPKALAPESLWTSIESKLDTEVSPGERPRVLIRSWKTQFAAVAAVLILIALVGVWFLREKEVVPNGVASWEVQKVNGTVRIGSSDLAEKGELPVGQWLETDGESCAQVKVANIGHVEIESNTRIRLVQTNPTEHRLELERGKLSARIWAPPRLFFVDTPSAVAADIGCAYTLQVDDAGASLLRVTSGWVALELKDRESMVPAGAACETRPGVGPGTPYFEDSSSEFRESLKKVDFDSDEGTRSRALSKMLSHSRKRDTLTLWHLIPRVEGEERGKVYDKIASFAQPPNGVTREGVLQLNGEMMELWRVQLEETWALSTPIPKKVAEAYWRLKNGIERRVDKLK